MATVTGILVRTRSAEASEKPGHIEFGSVTNPKHVFDKIHFHISDMSTLLGLPVKAGRYPSKDSRAPNPAAVGLFMHCDPEAETFGKVHFHPNNLTGTIIVVRTDGEELEMGKLKALVAYLGGEMKDEIKQFEEGEETGEEEKKKEKAREIKGRKLTKEAFEEFCGRYETGEVAVAEEMEGTEEEEQ